jgi:uncharacterized protein YjbI with pentapeptide repeats
MLSGVKAPVRPRILSSASGEALPLEDEIRTLLDIPSPKVVFLTGGRGAGKKTALCHLAALFPEANYGVAHRLEILGAHGNWLIVTCGTAPSGVGPELLSLPLAPWGDDELIEYLLWAHRQHCASVMSRVGPRDRVWLDGVPQLWRLALDEMARDPALPDARTALDCFLASRLDDVARVQLRKKCLQAVTQKGQTIDRLVLAAAYGPDLAPILRHSQVQMRLAAQGILLELHASMDHAFLGQELPPELIEAAAPALAHDELALAELTRQARGPAELHAMAVSLLHAAGAHWRPSPDVVPYLIGAYLKRIDLSDAALSRSWLNDADLSYADLRGADLRDASALRSWLRGAVLADARLDNWRAEKADLTGADLRRVTAPKSHWVGANLEGACLAEATLTEARFMQANLSGASFAHADLRRANLGLAQIEGAEFVGANLNGAFLNGLHLRSADCRDAMFVAAAMQQCDLEGMVLQRGAEANFHMGSTRSGTLIAPIASEGTRTGFYTDDALEQHFRAPEEIRKANLCGADLRGAIIDNVDFYLVDLRGAHYDATQAAHFRRTGAILDSRDD